MIDDGIDIECEAPFIVIFTWLSFSRGVRPYMPGIITQNIRM